MSKQVEAGALTRAVEVAAQADFERASAGYGHGWSDMSEAVRDTFRGAAAHAIQAADDHLREHYWAEFRERLRAAWFVGFDQSGDGYNGECPFGLNEAFETWFATTQPSPPCSTCDDTGTVCAECKRPRPRCTCGLNGASEDGCPELCAAQREQFATTQHKGGSQ